MVYFVTFLMYTLPAVRLCNGTRRSLLSFLILELFEGAKQKLHWCSDNGPKLKHR